MCTEHHMFGIKRKKAGQRLTSCGESEMRAALAKRVRSGGSSSPAPAAATGVTWLEDESGRGQCVLADGRLSRGPDAKRSLGMADAAAESMAGVARWSLLPPGTAKIGIGSSPPMRPHRLIPSHCFARRGPAHSKRPLPRAENPPRRFGPLRHIDEFTKIDHSTMDL